MACECEFTIGGGFGTMAFGGSPFGTGIPVDALALVGEARMVTANLAAVPYTGDPGLPNASNTQSPLYPGNWSLSADEPGVTLRMVQRVELVTTETLALFTEDLPQLASYELPFLLVWFDGVLDEGAVYSLELNTPSLAVTACACAGIVGLIRRRDALQSDARDSSRQIFDIANPFLTRDALRVPPELGAYQVDDKGDFGLDLDSESSLRKRIFRRVSTAAGGFFHLPGYGAAAKLKGNLTVDALERIASRVKAQVLQEPEVVDVRVTVKQVQGEPNMVSVSIRAVTGDGDPVGVVVPISLP